VVLRKGRILIVKAQIDGGDRELQTVQPPRLEQFVLSLTPRLRRAEVREALRTAYAVSPRTGALVKTAAKILVRVIPAMTVTGFVAAIFAGQIIVVTASLARYPPSIGIPAGIIAAMIPLCLRAGHHFPKPTRAEVFIDALMSMTFCIVSMLLVFVVRPLPYVPPAIMGRGVLFGVSGLTLFGLTCHAPKWNPQKYTPADCAYRWALFLNASWAIAWFGMCWASPRLSVPMLNALFIFIPICIPTAMYRRRQQGFKRAQKSDILHSLFAHDKQDLERKRGNLWTPKGILAEVVFFAVVVVQFVASIYLSRQFDALRAAACSTAALMLFIIWRYVRKANRRADILLAAELEKLAVQHAR
jgi:hypothetical protein